MTGTYPLRGVLPNTPVLTIGHRGARAYAPENTLAAFRKARLLGCQMVELDVRMSKDGELIVIHDHDLLRCTDAKAKFPGRDSYDLADFTYADLAGLDAGSWYAQELALPSGQRQTYLQDISATELAQQLGNEDMAYYCSGRVGLPTLAEALAYANRYGLLVNIELKGHAQAQTMTDRVVALVDSLGMPEKVIVSSFEHSLLAQVRQLSDGIATAVLCGDALEDPISYLQSLDADAYNLGYCGDNTDPLLIQQQISQLRALGFGVNVWTCNSPEQIQFLINAGVSGIITDFPDRVSTCKGLPK